MSTALREAEERYREARSALDAAGIDEARGELDPTAAVRIDSLVNHAIEAIDAADGDYPGDDGRAAKILRSWAAARRREAAKAHEAATVHEAATAHEAPDAGE